MTERWNVCSEADSERAAAASAGSKPTTARGWLPKCLHNRKRNIKHPVSGYGRSGEKKSNADDHLCIGFLIKRSLSLIYPNDRKESTSCQARIVQNLQRLYAALFLFIIKRNYVLKRKAFQQSPRHNTRKHEKRVVATTYIA